MTASAIRGKAAGLVALALAVPLAACNGSTKPTTPTVNQSAAGS